MKQKGARRVELNPETPALVHEFADNSVGWRLIDRFSDWERGFWGTSQNLRAPERELNTTYTYFLPKIGRASHVQCLGLTWYCTWTTKFVVLSKLAQSRTVPQH